MLITHAPIDGSERAIVTRPLDPAPAVTGDTYNRLAVEDRPASLFECIYVVKSEAGAFEVAEQVADALDNLYPEESASN